MSLKLNKAEGNLLVIFFLLVASSLAGATEKTLSTRVADAPLVVTKGEGIVHAQIHPRLGSVKIEREKVFLSAFSEGSAVVTVFYSDSSSRDFAVNVLPPWSETEFANKKGSLNFLWSRRMGTGGSSELKSVFSNSDIAPGVNLRFNIRSELLSSSKERTETEARLSMGESWVIGKGPPPSPFTGPVFFSRDSYFSLYSPSEKGAVALFGAESDEDEGLKGGWLSWRPTSDSSVSLEAAGRGGVDEYRVSFDSREGKRGRYGWSLHSSLDEVSNAARASHIFNKKIGDELHLTGARGEYKSTKKPGEFFDNLMLSARLFYRSSLVELKNIHSSRIKSNKASVFSFIPVSRDTDVTVGLSNNNLYGSGKSLKLLKAGIESVIGDGFLLDLKGARTWGSQGKSIGSSEAGVRYHRGMDESYEIRVSYPDMDKKPHWSMTATKGIGSLSKIKYQKTTREGYTSDRAEVRYKSMWTRVGRSVYDSNREDSYVEVGFNFSPGSIDNVAKNVMDHFNRYQGFLYVDENLNGKFDPGEEKKSKKITPKIVNVSEYQEELSKIDSFGMFKFRGFSSYSKYEVDFENTGDLVIYGDREVRDFSGVREFRAVELREVNIKFEASGENRQGEEVQAKIRVKCEGMDEFMITADVSRGSSVRIPRNGGCTMVLNTSEKFYSLSPSIDIDKEDAEAEFEIVITKESFIFKVEFSGGKRLSSVMQEEKEYNLDEGGFFESNSLGDVKARGYRCFRGRFFNKNEVIDILCRKNGSGR